MIGWNLLALGLCAASEHWDRGCCTQHLELPDVWREQAVIDAKDHRLIDSPVGWAGRLVLVTLWFATGTALLGVRRNHLLDSARAVASRSPFGPHH